MRIPVTTSDLNQGRFTKIARALQKILPDEQMGLMQAQNALAILLGYRDLHELQSLATPSAPTNPKTLWSRETINNAVGWKLFRCHGARLEEAPDVAAKLHLNMLAVDDLTSEASLERIQHGADGKGKLLLLDEYAYYLEPSWNPNTPDLLDARIPGYSHAVLPDKTVFRWSSLESMIRRLPDDFADDLKIDARYKHFGTDKAVEMAFIKQELYPQACVSLPEAAKVAQILPEGFKIKWVFSGGDVGRCLGRVLCNEALGGVIPVVYPSDTDDIFEAIGQLLCGEPIAARIAARTELPATSDEAVFIERFGHGGYDLAVDTDLASLETATGARQMKILSDSIRFRVVDGHAMLTGLTFIENGQMYLRRQKWMAPEDVPSSIFTGMVRPIRYREDVNDVRTIPMTSLDLFSFADESWDMDRRRSSKYIQSEQGNDKMIRLVFDLVSAPELDAYADALIAEALPLRDEGDDEDQDDLVAERTYEVDRMVNNGKTIKDGCPALASFKDLTLGYVLLIKEGEYPGGRNSSWVNAPAASDRDGFSDVLANLVLHAVSCKCNTPNLPVNRDALYLSIERVLDGSNPVDRFLDDYRVISKFHQNLRVQKEFIAGIQKWRDSEAAMQAIRSRGEFLHVGTPVSRVKPMGYADLVAQARKTGVAPIMVEQNLQDFEVPRQR